MSFSAAQRIGARSSAAAMPIRRYAAVAEEAHFHRARISGGAGWLAKQHVACDRVVGWATQPRTVPGGESHRAGSAGQFVG